MPTSGSSNRSDEAAAPETEVVPSETTPAAPPDPNTILSASASRYFTVHWAPSNNNTVVCPICGQTTWSILPVVDLPVRFSAGRALSLVPVQCETCKYVVLFNAVAAGLFGPDGLPADMPRESQPAAPDTP
jgi:hypothetical protein